MYEKQINIVSYFNAFLTLILELKMIYVSSLQYQTILPLFMYLPLSVIFICSYDLHCQLLSFNFGVKDSL